MTTVTRSFFGTDGIRGRVGEYPITAEFVLKLGWAAGRVLSRKQGGVVLIGKDTRISGYMFESALQAGLSAAGVNIRLLGPMPTPAIAYLTRTLHASGGIVISASHNPFDDNGIKFFSSQGTKLADQVEHDIEQELNQPMQTVESSKLGKALRIADAPGRYIEFCKSTIPMEIDLRGLKIVVDCAHGATYHVAPAVFAELGAEVVAIGDDPDGLNINRDCGSTCPQTLQQAVLAHGADVGIALDGDGDRVIMVDRHGAVVDGDELLYIIACARKRLGRCRGAVVGTQMSNLGLEHALRDRGIELMRAAVGDRYVMEMLQQHNLLLGGESSGHLICLDRTTTGDGIVAALQVLCEMVDRGTSLDLLKTGMHKYPQCLINVAIKPGFDFKRSELVQRTLQHEEQGLAGEGRILLRPSGTEPVVRVMVEGRDATRVKSSARRLADALEQVAQQS
ncbi:MAG: phosphoglucosamine mutase [Gammaproteobacteria bacterium]|nr:phosphoglucosamine mutase [Gammaproteobacteria bacterium]